MAIKVQEVTLRIVFDDEQMRGFPEEWAWQRSLKIGNASVGQAYSVAAVTAADVAPATEDEINEFNER